MMNPVIIPQFVRDELARLEIELGDDVLEQLGQYLQLLLETNKKFNLTAVRDEDSAWGRHIVDSLTVLPGITELEEGAKVMDVGSGGGLPGLVLAIAAPWVRFTLLEATGKKARFLEEAAASLGLGNVTVLNDRAETAGQDARYRQNFDVVVCRAVGPMRVLLEFTLPFVKVGGMMYAMKGPSVEQELKDAGEALEILGAGDLQAFEAYAEESDQNTVIISIEKERVTPDTYPRLPGTPKADPL